MTESVYTRITAEMAAHLQLRRFVFTVLTVSLTVNVALALHVLLAGDDTKTVVLAPAADTAYIAQSDKVSANLLERFGVTALSMVLNLTPSTADFQTARFLENVAPESWAQVKALLTEGTAELAKAKASVAFFPQAVSISEDTGDVCMTGERRVLIAQTVTSSEVKTLCAGTVVRAGRLWITRLTESCQ